jgi:folate-binding protein YgfZ
MPQSAILTSRRVLSVTGADRVDFLNGLVSNDVARAEPGRAVWAALLTPQGKYLADFFVFSAARALLVDCDAGQANLVATRLARFRLRADVQVAETPLGVAATWSGPAPGADLLASAEAAAPDPRLDEAGWRILSHQTPPATATEAEYDAHRLSLGLPDGARDMEPEKSVLLEAGFDELNGVSWTKGCYMGQELTARTRYRGLVKRRLLPVSADGVVPAPGALIMTDGKEAGVMRSGIGSRGLALLRLEAIGQPLTADGVSLHVTIPGWVSLPAPSA